MIQEKRKEKGIQLGLEGGRGREGRRGSWRVAGWGRCDGETGDGMMVRVMK